MSYLYNFNRKEITSEEIASRMNFGEVLSNYKIVTKPFYKTGWFYAATTVTLATITALIVFNNSVPDNEKQASTAVTESKKISYKEDSPCIKPPQKNADIPFQTYVINGDKDAKIIHSSGTEINIPSGAFSFKGKPITGDVEIKYREFHDMADCIMAGIPMTYDTAGTQLHFESAGMIEIRAFQNGNPLTLAKNMEVQMASDYTDTKYNLYRLDETEKNWVCLGKDKVNETTKEFTETTAGNENKIKVKEEKLTEVRREIAVLENNKPDAPAERNKSNFSFTLDVLADEFPELKAFTAERFEVVSADKNFSSKIFQTEWEDIKLKPESDSENLTMTLTKGTQSKKFTIYPVYDGTDLENRKVKYKQELKNYTAELETKEKEEAQLEKEIKDLRKKTLSNSKEISEQWSEKKKVHSTTMISKKDLEVYTVNASDAKYSNVRAVNGFLSSENFRATRSFQIGSLGVINVDCGVSKPVAERGKKHRFQWKNKEGLPLIMKVVFVLVKKRNVMFTYDAGRFGDIKMQEDGENIIVGITEEGYLAIAVHEDLKILNWDQKILDVEMRVLEKVKDADELKKIIYANS
jgi:cell division protein FtsB